MRRRGTQTQEVQRTFVDELPRTPCVVVTTTHGGNGYRSGGEYGYGYELYPTHDGVVVRYWTTCEWFEYCGHYGGFVREDECRRWGHQFQMFPWESARGEFDEVAVTAARQLLKGEEIDVDDDVYVDERGNVWVDATGHRYRACEFNGGCIICYPCNHAPCLARRG